MKTKLGLYGGTFAPVHNGHIRAALEFKDQFALDKLLIMPVAVPPHKSLPTGDSAYHRLNMLKLAFEDYSSVEISTYELDKPGTSYTVDTLEHFYNDKVHIHFLCGTDMLLTMHQWRQPDRIAKLATLVYTWRDNSTPDSDKRVMQQVEFLKTEFGFNIEELRIEPLELSSTLVREAEDKSPYLPEKVYSYIKEKNLYVH